MIGFFKDDGSRGSQLIRKELENAEMQLRDRRSDLEKARRYVAELEETCISLESKVADLKNDQRALDRGHVALMGDNSAQTA